jgi:tetratricopeptide (TPR) repeat protein
MSPEFSAPVSGPPMTTPGPPLHVYVLVLLVLAGAFAGAAWLGQEYHASKKARADAHFIKGRVLVDAGDLEQGITELRAAVTLDRGNAGYARLLARALAAAGAPREAQTYLDGVLARDPTSGIANLTQAQVARALEDSEGAEVFYQRAWFGVWPEGQQQRALVGFELADYLLTRGDAARAVGVLSQLSTDMPDTTDLLVRLGALFLQADAGSDAIPPLERAVARDPDHAEGWRTLAEAHFTMRNYAAARLAALRATELAPDSADAARIAQVSRDVLSLDPLQPRLATRERLRRWQRILDLSVDAYDACARRAEGPDVPAREEAVTLLALRVTALDEETLLPVIEQLWEARNARCEDVPPEYQALSLVLASRALREPPR